MIFISSDVITSSNKVTSSFLDILAGHRSPSNGIRKSIITASAFYRFPKILNMCSLTHSVKWTYFRKSTAEQSMMREMAADFHCGTGKHIISMETKGILDL